jgi:hypothetical protein
MIRWLSSEKVIKYVWSFIQVPICLAPKNIAFSSELYILMRRIDCDQERYIIHSLRYSLIYILISLCPHRFITYNYVSLMSGMLTTILQAETAGGFLY